MRFNAKTTKVNSYEYFRFKSLHNEQTNLLDGPLFRNCKASYFHL